ncbi:MAG: hypothetical protein AUH33_01435 [Chloroflexi bacterium 13_1_40CM_68_21]|nr:MAG: hypothetical protein AUH33_01435 [Chloroflexi bacterium 13_1_40CM_68_21]
MDLRDWVQLAVVLVVLWTLLVIVLLMVGRRILARELALLVPNLMRLFAGLMRDRRVPVRAKIVLGLASLWLASPIDLIPDFIPIVGSFDDAIVAGLALRILLGTTDERIVREHWRGDPATLDRILRLVRFGRGAPPPALP